MKTYIPVKYKLLISLGLTFSWFTFSLIFAQVWIGELAEEFNIFVAWFIVTGLALIPSIMNGFLLSSLILDKRPEYDVPDELPPLSIIIAAYNEEEFIADTLTSISRQEYPGDVEIVIVDDGSIDDTGKVVETFIEEYNGDFIFNLVKMPQNSGKANALNFGLKHIAHDIVATVDADSYLYRSSLMNIVNNLVTGPPKTAAVAGTVLVRNSRKNFMTKIQEWDYFHGIAVIKRVQSLFQGTLVAQGAFSVYFKEAIEDAGAWPDCVGEDIVLTWGFRAKGYRVGYAENAITFTNVPETYKQFYRQRKRWARGLIEAFKAHPGVIGDIRMNSIFVWINLMFPYLDFIYLFVFLPGLVAALVFQYYAVVGILTFLLLPLAVLINWVMFFKQRAVFDRNGLKVRKNLLGFTIYLLFYQMVVSPASLMGYLSEFLNLKKVWETK